MRGIVILAAMLAAAVMAPEPAEAGKRGLAFHSSPHGGGKFHRSHRGLKFDQRRFGQHRNFEQHGGHAFKFDQRSRRHGLLKPQQFRHFGRGGHAFEFERRGFEGRHLRLMPRQFPHSGKSGLVLKFRTGDFMARFGHLPRSGHEFDHGSFDRSRHFRAWRHRGLALRQRHELPGHSRQFRQSVPHAKGGRLGSGHGAAPPPALLRELERLGFRHVPKLLSERSR